MVPADPALSHGVLLPLKGPPMSHHRRSTDRRSARVVIAALALLVLVVTGAAGTANAAKGGGGGKPGGGGGKDNGSVSLVVLDGSDQVANHLERVGFEVATTATDRPFVGVRCWQGSAYVFDGYTGYFDSYMFDPWVTLDSPYWTAGQPADCTARLFAYDRRGNQKVLATVDFPVAP